MIPSVAKTSEVTATHPDVADFARPDTAAAILLGIPGLVGILLLFATLVPHADAPTYDRRTTVPVALALALIGAVGWPCYLRWRDSEHRRRTFYARVRAGALRLGPRDQTPELVQLSHDLAEGFQLPAGSCTLPATTPVTAGDIANAVHATILERSRADGAPLCPESLDRARAILSRLIPPTAKGFSLATDLNAVLPTRARRLVRHALLDYAQAPPPPLVPRTGACFLLPFLIAGALLGTFVPAAIWLDHQYPGHDLTRPLQFAAALIVPAAFMRALHLYARAAERLLALAFPAFPPDCRTVGRFAARIRTSHAGEPWSLERVWIETRRLIASAFDRNEADIHPTTHLDTMTR